MQGQRWGEATACTGCCCFSVGWKYLAWSGSRSPALALGYFSIVQNIIWLPTRSWQGNWKIIVAKALGCHGVQFCPVFTPCVPLIASSSLAVMRQEGCSQVVVERLVPFSLPGLVRRAALHQRAPRLAGEGSFCSAGAEARPVFGFTGSQRA